VDTASAIATCTKLISYDYSSLIKDHYTHTLYPLYDSILTWNTSAPARIAPKQRTVKRQVFSFVHGTLHISELHGAEAKIRILNTCGQTLFQNDHVKQGCTVNLMSLSSGVYFVYVKTDHRFLSGSFIKK
jgi:hypothetical protein